MPPALCGHGREWDSGVGGGGEDGIFGGGGDSASFAVGAGAGVGKSASVEGDGRGGAGRVFGEEGPGSGGDAAGVALRSSNAAECGLPRTEEEKAEVEKLKAA